MKELIKLRAHHLICIPRFYSGGYDEEFEQNMKKICLHIRENPGVKIKVLIGEMDHLCEKCPHKSENRCIQSKEIGKWVVSQDKKVANFLNIELNSIHEAKDIFNLSLDKIHEDTIGSVCEGCIFHSNCMKVGVNNSFKKDLNKNYALYYSKRVNRIKERIK